jgi:4-amino-4-deoxy-L-arabinose transferase-like glycosyltransferase
MPTLSRHGEPERRAIAVAIQDWRALLAIFAMALILRAVCAILFSGEIDPEGAEYGRIAENIRKGMGYRGIATEGVQLFFPPLFPLLIAGVSMLGCTTEAAGRAISILFGALLVIPVFGIAKRMFGRACGLGAAAIVAVHPFLITISTTVYCEPTYLTLVLAAVWMGMLASDRSDRRLALAAGLLYGLAALVRPEALIFMLVGLAFLIVQRALAQPAPLVRLAIREAPRAGLMVGCFGLVVLPYVAWLSLETGEFRLQTKSILNMATDLRIRSGLPPYAASFAVGENLDAEGTYNQPNIDVIRKQRSVYKEYLKILPQKTIDVLRNAAAASSGAIEFGSPVLFALAVLGLFGRPWSTRGLVDQAHMVTLLVLTSLALFFIYFVSLRFFVLFLTVFCIWATAGLCRFAEWARLTFSPRIRSERWRARVVPVSVMLGLAAMLMPAALFAIKEMVSTHGSRPIKALAMMLAAQSRGLTIADTSTPFSFHANASFVWLPYCDEPTALKYLALKQVTHVVVRSNSLDEVPYLRSWHRKGPPGGELVAEAPYSRGRLVQVFRLRRSP